MILTFDPQTWLRIQSAAKDAADALEDYRVNQLKPEASQLFAEALNFQQHFYKIIYEEIEKMLETAPF